MQPFKVSVFYPKLRLGANTNTRGWIDNLMEGDWVCLEADRHALVSKIANVVSVYVVLTPCPLNKLDVGRIKMELEELGE